MRSFTRAAVVATLLAAASTAQSKAVLGRDNAAFARALLDAGYDDMAEGLGKAIGADTGSAAFEKEKLEIQAIALDIRQVRTLREADPLQRIALILAVIKDKNAFINDNSRLQVAEALRAGLPDAYMIFGDSLAKALKAESDPEKTSALRKQGQETFAAGETALKERVDRYKDQLINDPGVNQGFATRQYASAFYSLGVMYYFHSLVYPSGDPDQKRLLQQSLDTFLEFGLDFGDDLLNYRGSVFQGLCNSALGKDKQALADFDYAIGLRTSYGPAHEGGAFTAVPPDAVDVISWAFQEKIRLLSDQGKHEAALAAARDYFATLPKPLEAERGLAVLQARAKEEKATGNTEAARASAEELVAADANGQYGFAGRQMLAELVGGGGGAAGPAGLVRIAETLATGGEFNRALDLCRQAREQALGTPDAADVGASSYMLEGSLFGRLNRLQEASLAFDLVAELYPSHARAGDGLWNAVQAYQELAKNDRGPYYAKRAKDRMLALATRYPNHPKAAYAQLVEAKQLEGAGEWQKAVDLYLQMKAGSGGYEEGQFRAGNALYRLAQKLQADKKDADATNAFQRAEQQLRAAIALLDKAAAETLDRTAQADLEGLAFQARGVLANLLLDRNRAAEVEPLLVDAEARHGSDVAKMSKIWVLRIQARIGQGKLDDAVQLLDSLIQKDPSGVGIAAAAGAVARALDQAGVDEFEKNPGSATGVQLWRKAAHYYSLSIRPQLDGREALDDDYVSKIAQRLVIMGLSFNEVADNSFVGWQGKAKEPDVWEQAVAIFRKLLTQAPSTRTSIQLARTLGLLGKDAEANEKYAEVFDRQKLFTSAGALDSGVLSANPDLLDAYLEWGVTEHRVGMAEKDKTRLKRAGDIFDRMVKNTESGSARWWAAKYYQIRNLYDRGDYANALLAIKDVKRTQNEKFDDNRYGWKDRFVALDQDIAKKTRGP